MAAMNTPVDRQPETPPAPLHFGDFRLDIGNARLTRGGQVVELPPKSFAVLTLLAQRPGQLVLKDSLLDAVWGRRFVSEGAVKTVVSELRAALGDDARAPRWIETVQGRGYRFLGLVQQAPPPAPDGAAAAPARGNLPAYPSPAFGRQAEHAALSNWLATRRLVTLVGTAGVGKSLLAQEVAAQHAAPDGVWRVELAPLGSDTDAATLRATLAQVLQLADAAAVSDQTLAQALSGLSLLLLVDNAEHQLELLAPLLSHLLAQAAGLQLLVTSREPLQLAEEQVVRLAPLGVPSTDDDADLQRVHASAAVQLFVQRVAARLPSFRLDAAQARTVAQLCRALDGLPLALELAAARVPALGIAGLADMLAREEVGEEAGDAGRSGGHPRLQLLGPGLRGAAPHQRTLRAALDWSHALLTPPQQQVLRRLAVFRGGFTLAAARTVAGGDTLDEWAVLDALQALVDKSLLNGPANDAGAADGAAAQGRFTQLESLRAYAHERLVESGELEATQRRHFFAMLDDWRQADTRALGDPALAWVQRHVGQIDNLRAALRWGCRTLVAEPDTTLARALLALAGHSALLWHRAGHASEGVRWCQDVLGLMPADTAPEHRAGVDLALAHLSGIGMVLPARDGLAAARRAVAVYTRPGDDSDDSTNADANGAGTPAGDAVRGCYALYLQHTLMCRAEPLADRSDCIARMQALVQPDWSELLKRFARSAAAYEARLQGRFDAYLQFNREELARCRAVGAVWESWSAAIGLMLAEHDNGRTAVAIEVGREVLAEIRTAGRLRQNANRLAIWTMMLAQSGDTTATRQALDEALPVLRSAGRPGMAQLALAWLAWHEQRPAAAARMLGRFDAPQRTGGEFGPGTYIRRSTDALWLLLQQQLGAADVAAQRAAAEGLSDAAALQQVLG
jgi:predicted ATPase/DNA-binding winged helix-turn-helix (wHTH) protein